YKIYIFLLLLANARCNILVMFNRIPIPDNINETNIPNKAAPSHSYGDRSLVSKNMLRYSIPANTKGPIRIIYLVFLLLILYISRVITNIFTIIPINIKYLVIITPPVKFLIYSSSSLYSKISPG